MHLKLILIKAPGKGLDVTTRLLHMREISGPQTVSIPCSSSLSNLLLLLILTGSSQAGSTGKHGRKRTGRGGALQFGADLGKVGSTHPADAFYALSPTPPTCPAAACPWGCSPQPCPDLAPPPCRLQKWGPPLPPSLSLLPYLSCPEPLSFSLLSHPFLLQESRSDFPSHLNPTVWLQLLELE